MSKCEVVDRSWGNVPIPKLVCLFQYDVGNRWRLLRSNSKHKSSLEIYIRSRGSMLVIIKRRLSVSEWVWNVISKNKIFKPSPRLQLLTHSPEICCTGTFHHSTHFCRWKFFVTSKVKVTEASKIYYYFFFFNRLWKPQIWTNVNETWTQYVER